MNLICTLYIVYYLLTLCIDAKKKKNKKLYEYGFREMDGHFKNRHSILITMLFFPYRQYTIIFLPKHKPSNALYTFYNSDRKITFMYTIRFLYYVMSYIIHKRKKNILKYAGKSSILSIY